jgi:hypothetical protein
MTYIVLSTGMKGSYVNHRLRMTLFYMIIMTLPLEKNVQGVNSSGNFIDTID